MVLTGGNRAWLYACVAGLLASITWIDSVTGYELGFFVFYFVPVGLALTLSSIQGRIRELEDLLHVVSHDLRAQLGAVIGQAQVLRRRADGDSFAVDWSACC
jgi:signal transduction histidine kinase